LFTLKVSFLSLSLLFEGINGGELGGEEEIIPPMGWRALLSASSAVRQKKKGEQALDAGSKYISSVYISFPVHEHSSRNRFQDELLLFRAETKETKRQERKVYREEIGVKLFITFAARKLSTFNNSPAAGAKANGERFPLLMNFNSFAELK
jgi:hypothetical protein